MLPPLVWLATLGRGFSRVIFFAYSQCGLTLTTPHCLYVTSLALIESKPSRESYEATEVGCRCHPSATLCGGVCPAPGIQFLNAYHNCQAAGKCVSLELSSECNPGKGQASWVVVAAVTGLGKGSGIWLKKQPHALRVAGGEEERCDQR